MKKRVPTWLAVVATVIALPFAFASALWEYMSVTATPLHPNALEVPSEARSAPPPRWEGAVDQARQIVRAAVTEQNLPGLSVAVSVGGEIVWAEGFGWADIETQAKVTPKTRFRIGTASTALTSAAVGLLLEKGKLSLDDTIQTHVPEFPQKKWPVTLRQVMGHLAGLRNDGGDEGPLFSQHCERPVQALPFIAEGSLRFEPGTQFRNSRYGWILMSAAVEAAAKESFLSFMRKQIFEPLGMEDTTADTATIEAVPVPIRGQATSYFPKFAGDPRYGPDPMRPIDYSCYAGSSSFLSTPTDLTRFAIAMGGGKLLQPKTVQRLQTTQRLASGEETGYGLGWEIEPVELSGKPTKEVGYDGDLLGGRAASFMTFPEHGIVVSVLSNTSYADTFSIGLKTAQAFEGARPR